MSWLEWLVALALGLGWANTVVLWIVVRHLAERARLDGTARAHEEGGR